MTTTSPEAKVRLVCRVALEVTDLEHIWRKTKQTDVCKRAREAREQEKQEK